MQKITVTALCAFALLFQACGADEQNFFDPPVEALSAVDSDVLLNTSAVNQMVLEDTLDAIELFEAETLTFLVEVLNTQNDQIGFDGITREDLGFLSERYNPAFDLGEQGSAFVNVGQFEPSGCGLGGSISYSGNLLAQAGRLTSSDSGRLSGSYRLIYESCSEIVLMQTSTATCAVEITLDGEITNTLESTFRDITIESTRNSLDIFNEADAFRETQQLSSNTNAMFFNIGDGVIYN